MLIYALDGLDQIGQITDWSEIKVTERDLDLGTWSIRVPLDGASGEVIAKWFDDDTDTGIEVYDPDTGWRFGGIGMVRGYERTVDGGEITVVGVDHMKHLANHVYFHPNGADFPTLIWARVRSGGFAGFLTTTAVHDLVWEQLVPNSGNANQTYRLLPNLTGPYLNDPAGGVDVLGYDIEPDDSLLDLIRMLMADADYTARMQLTRTAGGTPSIHFSTPERQDANARLSLETGGYERVVVTQKRSAATHTIVVGGRPNGAPDTDPRQVARARRTGKAWADGLYGEHYIDRDGYIDEALQVEFDNLYHADRATETARFDGVNVTGWGRDVDLGWYVPAEVGLGGRTQIIELPVGSSELSGTPGDLTRTISVGEHRPEGVEKLLEMVRGLDRRVKKVAARG